MPKAQIHLPGAGRAVVRGKQIKPVGVGSVQRCAHKIRVRLQAHIGGRGALERATERQNLGCGGRNSFAAEIRRYSGRAGYGSAPAGDGTADWSWTRGQLKGAAPPPAHTRG